MISKEQLVRCTNEKEAGTYYSDYDVIPFPKTGPIVGYFFKGEPGPHNVSTGDLIGGGTSILDFVRLLTRRPFYFVLHANEIAGYVHFSDLNQPYVRIPLYGVVQLLEYSTWQQIGPLLRESDVREITKEHFRKVDARRKKNQKNNVGQGWVGALDLQDLLRLATKYGKNQLTETQVKVVTDFRNRIAHPHGNLIDRIDEISSIAETTDLCIRTVQRA